MVKVTRARQNDIEDTVSRSYEELDVSQTALLPQIKKERTPVVQSSQRVRKNCVSVPAQYVDQLMSREICKPADTAFCWLGELLQERNAKVERQFLYNSPVRATGEFLRLDDVCSGGVYVPCIYTHAR